MKSINAKTRPTILASVLVGAALSFIANAHPILDQFKVNNSGFVGLMQERDAAAKEEWAYSVGIQAFLFSLPMVMHDVQRDIRMKPKLIERIKHTCPCAVVGKWGHYSALASAKAKMPYTPNPDTVYSGIVADLSVEPMIIKVPDIQDRYFSIQLADAYLVNQHYIGTRATEGKGGYFALVGPDWKGNLPVGVTEMRFPNNAAIVALRIASYSNTEEDLQKVRAEQKKFDSFPLSQWDMSEQQRAEAFTLPTLPPTNLNPKNGELAYFNYISQLLIENPPVGENRSMLKTFEYIGLSDKKPFNAEQLDEPTKRGLKRAIEASTDIIKWKVKFRGTQSENKWNVDFVGGAYGTDYLARAEGSVQGLFVHSPEEAVYFHTYSDINNQPLLGGENQYTLHFEKSQLPPSYEGGFWSIALYGDDYQFVDNKMDRYAIRKSTDGLQFSEDGSLTIYLQNTPPEGRESNWLPTPTQGIFRLNFRVYLPDESVRQWSTVEQYLPGVTPKSK